VINIAAEIKKEIEELKATSQRSNIGTIIEIGDGIARVEGLSDVAYNELVEFPSGLYGLALNLEEGSVGVVIFGDYKILK